MNEIEDFLMQKRENGMLLSNYQIRVLKRNNIDYQKFKNLKELLFYANEIDTDDSDDEIEEILRDIDEQNYYQYVNK